MAIPPSRTPTKAELDRSIVFKRYETITTICVTLIRYGTFGFLGYCLVLIAITLAGRSTLAQFVVQVLGNVSANRGVVALVTGSGWVYGLAQRALRRKHIKRITNQKNALERKIDPNRTSSLLPEDGTTPTGG